MRGEQGLKPRGTRLTRLVLACFLLVSWSPAAPAARPYLQEQASELERIAFDSGQAEGSRRLIYQVASSLVSLPLRYAPGDEAAARLALTAALRSKGIALDYEARALSAARRTADDDQLARLHQYARFSSRLALLDLYGQPGEDPERRRQVRTALEKNVEIARRRLLESAPLPPEPPPTTDDAQSLLSEDVALIELVVYQPYRHEPPAPARPDGEEAHLAACVLRHTGAPRWFELGPAPAIDARAARLLEALSGPRRGDADAEARALFDAIIAPLLPALDRVRHLIIAPDGQLNLVPFGALVNRAGDPLIRRFTLSYLSSGRDLLRIDAGTRATSGPLIVAAPAFTSGDEEAPAGARSAPGRGSADRRRSVNGMHFSHLPGTLEEARMVGELLTGAQVLTGARATERALRSARGPSILHLATHGFFMESIGGPATGRGVQALEDDVPLPTPSSRSVAAGDPMLRSGIALAGANDAPGPGDDGIFTALEASLLDLIGTDLVVLSACETGVGKTVSGEGVYGLRRALTLAGAESQVLSLWKVDDVATRDLMVSFYRHLLKGEARGEALRSAQLELQGRPPTRHPYFWAAFTLSGDYDAINPADLTSR
jgi:CHAT domain-containing protein